MQSRSLNVWALCFLLGSRPNNDGKEFPDLRSESDHRRSRELQGLPYGLVPGNESQFTTCCIVKHAKIRLQMYTLAPPRCVRLVGAMSHFSPQRRIAMQSPYGGQQLFVVAIQNSTLALFDHLRQAPYVACDRGRSRSTGFEESDGENLVAQGRHNHRYCMATIVLQLFLCELAKEVHICHALCLLPEGFFARASTRDQQIGTLIALEGRKNRIYALDLLQSPHIQEIWLRMGRCPVGRPILIECGYEVGKHRHG